ncbi:MAG: S9 family peptidase [Pirellulales bacterium]
MFRYDLTGRLALISLLAVLLGCGGQVENAVSDATAAAASPAGADESAAQRSSADPQPPTGDDTPAQQAGTQANTATEGESVEARSNGETSATAADLIPRQVLFGNPDRAAARISPDGTKLSFLAPVEGVLNVWVGPVDDPSAAKPVTQDKVRGIRSYFWAYTGKHILYTQDKGGDENWHVYAVDLESGETKDLTPLEEVHATIEGVSERIPGEVLVGLNNRNPQLHDIYKVDLASGERTLLEENPGYAGYLTDDDLEIRFAFTFLANGDQQILKATESGEWEDFLTIPSLDAMTTSPAGFDKTGQRLYMIDSRDRNTAALFSLDLETGEQTLIAENPRADVGGVLAHPTEKTIQAVSFTYARKEWQVLDDAVAEDMQYLTELEDGELQITGRTLDDDLWTVAYILDDGPVKYYLYDRSEKKARFLFTNRDDLNRYPLAKMHPEIIKSRDGLDLVSYVTLPKSSDPDGDARPGEPLPMVLYVHGGPWSRSEWGYNPTHQWLANRGYAVLDVNFRGSTGLGKDFINAANAQWSKKMHDDLLDAVSWAVEQKIADANKVAIMGGSYGGYATLVGLTFTPEVFACGVDIVGPSNLVTLLENVPPYWIPIMPVMKERVGDHSTEVGRGQLLAMSPLSHVERIERPLLIGQGAHDPRVKQVESDQIVEAMKEKDIPVTYVLYPDEGHGFVRPPNRMSFWAVTEAFLTEHLGGRFEPIGDDFEGASITVPAGAEGVPGLGAALENGAANEGGE